MALSITQRLTITVALLSGLILAPAGIAFYLYLDRGIESNGLEQAQMNALDVDDAILGQIDEEILVDFAGQRVPFNGLDVPVNHWAVIRKNGSVEAARGVFRNNPYMALSTPNQDMRRSDSKTFSLASIPLVTLKTLTWDDISQPAQATILDNVEDDTVFLNAKQEVAGKYNVIGVKWLYADRIVEVAVTEEGKLVEIEAEDMPDQLPSGMEIDHQTGQTVLDREILDWKAYDSELIAIVNKRTGTNQKQPIAINRFGEQYTINTDGSIGPMLEETRLWVVVAYDMTPDMARMQSIGRFTLLGGLLLWILITLIAWLVTRRALTPVTEIVKQAEKIQPSQLDERLPIGSVDDELTHIARTVNKMLDRIQGGYQREQQFTGDVSHEMRNPLAKMIAEIDLTLSKNREQAEYKDALERIRKYALGMQQLIESLLMLARLEANLHQQELKPFDVAEIVMESLKRLPQESMQRICLEIGQSDSPLEAVGHRHLIGVMLFNLIDNALRYSPRETPVTLRVNMNAKSVHVEVEDEGPGIPSDQIEPAFNRFQRLEKSRSRQTGGVGLGLSIVKAIADMHDLEITLSPGEKQGTLAAFSLPT